MKNLSIFKKILIVFTTVGLLAIIVDSLVANNIFKNTIINNADTLFYHDLKRKKFEVQKYFDLSEQKIENMGKSFVLQDIFKTLINYHRETGTKENEDFPVQTVKYNQLTKKHLEYYSDYIKLNNYYDIFFICAEHGHVMFTATHENDFGTNLSTGKYKDTHLAEVWRKIVSENQTEVTDYQSYAWGELNLCL